jgi:Tfp pilus assembly protein PilO
MRQLKYIWRTYREIIIAVALCMAGFGGLFFGVVPTAKNTLATLDEIKTLSAHVEALSQKAATLDALSEDTLREQLAVIVSAIPTDKAVPSVFATVESVVATAGVEVMDMSVTQAGSLATASAQKLSTEEKTIGASLLPFSVTIRGPMEKVRAFIGRIGSVRRLARIRNFDVSVISPEVIQARLALEAFYVPLPTSLAKVDEALAQLSKEQQDALTKLATFPWFSQPKISAPQGPVYGNRENPFSR